MASVERSCRSCLAEDAESRDDSSSQASSSDLKEEPKEPIAPDSGYSWVILAASFLSSVIVDGVCFAFGIFLLEFLDYFKEDRAKTAWVGSVLNGTYMIMGPIAGALANKFGCRRVAIVGGVWSSAAFVLSTLSPNVNVLIFTYGVLGGMGFGLLYLPSIVVVGHYFDKKRAFATGVATCGSGIGAFIFAPMSEKLIECFTWKGAQWIVAGIVLNGVILGALYRPLTERDRAAFINKWKAEQEEKARRKQRSVSTAVELDEDLTYFNGKETVPMAEKVHAASQGLGNRMGDSWHSLSYFGSVDSLNKCTEDGLRHRKYSQLSQEPGTADAEAQGKSTVANEILDSIKSTMDISMLRNPVFVIYALSCVLCMMGFFVPFIYLPDHTIGLGYGSSQAAFLLSILGITNTIGRIVTGWISDRPWADCLMINNIALIVGGFATILCPFCNNYVLLTMYASVFGLCIAAFVSLRPIILVDLIGIDKLTSSFGIIVLCQGVSSFVGAPFAGWLFDVTANYNVSFYVAGTTIALAGLICLPLRRIADQRNSLTDA